MTDAHPHAIWHSLSHSQRNGIIMKCRERERAKTMYKNIELETRVRGKNNILFYETINSVHVSAFSYYFLLTHSLFLCPQCSAQRGKHLKGGTIQTRNGRQAAQRARRTCVVTRSTAAPAPHTKKERAAGIHFWHRRYAVCKCTYQRAKFFCVCV